MLIAMMMIMMMMMIIIIIIIIIIITMSIIIHADGCRVGRVSSGVYVFVSLSIFPHDISKTDAARINKLDTEMLHD